MRKLLIDQGIFLIIGIGIMWFIPRFLGFFTWIAEIAMTLSLCFLCRYILLLPFDLILGIKKRVVFFSTTSWYFRLDTFRNSYYPVWKFYCDNHHTFQLLIPYSIKREATHQVATPPKDEKIYIKYLRLSKILLHWESLS